MQFKVPQFIDIEDKVFGPLTFRQFIYLAGGAGLSYLSIRILPGIFALIAVPLFAGLALALAFIKYNEKPFINTLEAFIRFYSKSRFYLWHKSTTKKQLDIPLTKTQQGNPMSESRLQTLSWTLDVIDNKK